MYGPEFLEPLEEMTFSNSKPVVNFDTLVKAADQGEEALTILVDDLLGQGLTIGTITDALICLMHTYPQSSIKGRLLRGFIGQVKFMANHSRTGLPI